MRRGVPGGPERGRYAPPAEASMARRLVGLRRGRTNERGFTMIELIVAVGLMIVVLGVLAFVFRQAAGAVASATEAVTVVQKARNFEDRLGRELASAVAYLSEEGTALKSKAARGFIFDDKADEETSARCIEFVSQTMNDGILDTWDVKYHYEADLDSSGQPLDYGSIKRCKDARNKMGNYVLWDHQWEEDDEIVAWPVRVDNELFVAAVGWSAQTVEDQNPRLPPYVKVKVIFLDTWGGRTFRFPMVFYFPVYQGG